MVTCHGSELEFWDIHATSAPLYTAQLSGDNCAALAVSADGTTFAVTTAAGVFVGHLPASWK